MNALINYDGGENEVRTNIPTRFHLAWWLSASLTTLRSLKNNDLPPLLIKTNLYSPTSPLPVCIVNYAAQSEEQRLAAPAYINISIFSHITTTNVFILRTPWAASPIPRSHNARSLSTIFHTSPCMLPARLLKSFDSDNSISRRRSLSVHIGRT